MTGYRDDPDWQEAQAALIDPGETGDRGLALRIAAAVRMHDIERAQEAQADR